VSVWKARVIFKDAAPELLVVAITTRLRALVEHAHANGLWIRFYTLDGATKDELSCHGWFRNYNFGSLAAAQQRWRAAQSAGVDYIASDQYETLAEFLKGNKAIARDERQPS
jgi:glycerophosphoryl diester phosphodiesterase